MKYYFCGELLDVDSIYLLEYILEEMEEQEVDSVVITEAVRNTGEGFFYCKKYNEVGMTGDFGCGKLCEFYKPRNGKSGICKHWGYTYEEGDKSYRLFRNGVKN
jgi:hypothetical protein